MPITSIILQPASESLKFAYRPIVFTIGALQNDATADKFIPPVVFCDVYVNGKYFKSIYKTQPANKPVFEEMNPVFKFDIQDACQEVLKPVLPTIGQQQITEIDGLVVSIYCRFRAGSINEEGFVVYEDVSPIQGTDQVEAVPGGGVESNTFNVVNATIEHEEFVDEYSNFLSKFKSGIWSSQAFPLTPRPSIYKICRQDNDVFPVLYSGTKKLKCIKINYKLKGSESFSTEQSCITIPACQPPVFSSEIELPDITVGGILNQELLLNGSTPMSINTDDSNIPTWITVRLRGNRLTVFGIPGSDDVGTDIPISIVVANACGTATFSDTIDVNVQDTCVPVTFNPLQVSHDGKIGVPYSRKIYFDGTLPVTLVSSVKPAWASAAVVDNYILVTGTPDVAGNEILFQFTVSNCSGATDNYSDIIKVADETSETNFSIENNATGLGQINSISPMFFLIYTGDMPLTEGQSLTGYAGGWSGRIMVNVSGISNNYLNLYKNGLLVESKHIVTSGSYYLNFTTPVSFNSGDIMKIELTN